MRFCEIAFIDSKTRSKKKSLEILSGKKRDRLSIVCWAVRTRANYNTSSRDLSAQANDGPRVTNVRRKPAWRSREHFRRSTVGGRARHFDLVCHVSAGSSRGRPTWLLLLEQFRIRAERAHQIQRERKRKPRVPRSEVPFATRVCDRHRSQGGLQRRARRRVRMAMVIQLQFYKLPTLTTSLTLCAQIFAKYSLLITPRNLELIID